VGKEEKEEEKKKEIEKVYVYIWGLACQHCQAKTKM
jgi:hypothetical protein